jgi:hemerythrin-like domain-containing protein
LLAIGDPALTSAVNTLLQDHGWIEENWIELSPQLSAIASGNNWPDPAEFLHGVQVFVELCTDHIALEESVVYPESRAHWARAVAARALREKVRPA